MSSSCSGVVELSSPSTLLSSSSTRKRDRKSTRLNSSHSSISYAVFCLKKKKGDEPPVTFYINPGEPWQTVNQIFTRSSLITLPGTLLPINVTTDNKQLADYATALGALF